MVKTFSISEALSAGWRIFKARPLFFVVLPFLPAVASILISVGGSVITGGLDSIAAQNPDNSLVSTIIAIITIVEQLIAWVVSAVIGLGVNGIYRSTVEGKTKRINEVFDYKYALIPSLIGSVLIGLGSVVGIFLLVIPGIIWMIATEFFTFTVLTPGTGPIVAIKESMRITKGVRLKLFLFGVALWLLNVAGVLCLMVGMLITIPVSGLALAYVYNALKQQSGDTAALVS